jgi:hypothetical protein
MQKNKRRHKRFKLDLIEISGKMSLTDKVEIINISIGGVALKADRRLNIGKEYLIKLGEKGKSIDVKGVIVRSELSGIEQKANGDQALIYTAGMMFKNGQEGKIADFLSLIEQNIKKEVPVTVDRRIDVRFQIMTPQEKVLHYPAEFVVKEISLGGMRIHTTQTLDIETRIPMDLALGADKSITFIGRVASFRKLDDKGQMHYEIGVEFTDVKDNDRTMLKTFIDYLTIMQSDDEEEQQQADG